MSLLTSKHLKKKKKNLISAFTGGEKSVHINSDAVLSITQVEYRSQNLVGQP